MADEIDVLKATRILAFRAVEEKDPDYVYRHILRWYSKEFSTPLAEVEALPMEDVLTHYFECRYEAMDEEELEEEGLELRMTEAEKKLKKEEEERANSADADFERMVAANVAAKALPKAAPGLGDAAIPNSGVSDPPLHPAFQDLANAASATMKQIPPDIKMEFVDEGELADLDSWDILGPPRPEDK